MTQKKGVETAFNSFVKLKVYITNKISPYFVMK